MHIKCHDIYFEQRYSFQEQLIFQKMNTCFQQRYDLIVEPGVHNLLKQQDSYNIGVYILYYIYIFSLEEKSHYCVHLRK